MNFIQPQNRTQFTFGSLEDLLAADNRGRQIDAFTEQLDLKRLGFLVAFNFMGSKMTATYARATNHLVLLSIHEEKVFLNGKNIIQEPCDVRVSSTVL